MPTFDASKPFDRHKGIARMRGVAWQRNETTGDWERHQMRVYPDGEVYWSKTYRLYDAQLPFCLQCLSNNVTFYHATKSGKVTWCCHDCDVGFFTILAEGDDPEDVRYR